MANRTFKVYGQAYAESGDVTATLSINGTQVFSGAVNDSTTGREGQPTIKNHLFTFELDENTTGDLSYSLAVSGGELCLGPTEYNGTPTMIIPKSWWGDRRLELGLEYDDFVALRDSAEGQAYVATQIGQALLDAEQSGLYDKLMAGTADPVADAEAIQAANSKGPLDYDSFVTQDDVRSSAQIDGEALPDWDNNEVNTVNWVIIQDGQTFTCTLSLDPTSHSRW